MGTSYSNTASTGEQLSPLQRDIKYLGDRMPFGDRELFEVYKAYHSRKEKTELISFLTDIGLLCCKEEEKEELFVLLQAVEQKILPPNFGNRLYETCFLRPQDVSEYDSDSLEKAAAAVAGSSEEDEYTRLAKLEAFFEGLSNGTRRGAKKTLKVLMACCKQHPAPISETPPMENDFSYGPSRSQSPKTVIDPLEFVNIGYRVALASAFLTATQNSDEHQDIGAFLPNEDASQHPGLLALAGSLVDLATKRKQRNERSSTPNNEKKKLVDEHDVLEWAEHVAPLFASSLATFLHTIFFPDRPYPPTRTSFDYPTLEGFDSTFFTEGNSPLLFSFGCMSSSLNGEFYRLYTSASDGLSFNRLQNSLLGYGGPTLLIIQSGDSIFGAFTASSWKESKDFYGNSDCFLFQLLPTTAIYRPSGNDTKYMYCNSFARSRGYDRQAHGIGFGGTVQQPRLFLPESFDDCRAAERDLTFEKGPLLNTNLQNFEIDSLEVWGCGGTEVVQVALGARDRQRDIKDAAIRKARKVDKAAFLDDFRSGLISSKAFAHREQMRGRGSACVNDDDPNDYKLPK